MPESNDGPLEAELILLICNLFPNGFRIPVEDLATYGMSLKFFEGVKDMTGARDRVLELIKIINHRYLAILQLEDDMYGNRCVKKMAGALEVATWNASTYQLVFRHGTIQEKWPEKNRFEDCYGLFLVLKKLIENPIHFECPSLSILRLQLKCPQCLPFDFFEGMKELRVLSLGVPSFLQPLHLPRKLRVLRIEALRLDNMFVIRSLRDLEFLSISTRYLSHIPNGMGKLGNLRYLNLRNMNLGFIPPGVLSRMLKLEELHLPLSFRGWGCTPKECHFVDEFDDSRGEENNCHEEIINESLEEKKDGSIINATAREIASLFSLNALHMCVPNASILSNMSPVFRRIQKYKIVVQDKFKYQPLGNNSLNEVHLTGDASDLKDSGICSLMRITEELSLTKIKNLKNVVYQLDDGDFPQLKKMIITECDELVYLVDSTKKRVSSTSFCMLEILHLSMLCNLREIWHGTDVGWFRNLRQINIRFCHKLNYVFPAITLGLMQLESIEILDCIEMEGVFKAVDDNSVDQAHVNCIRNLNLQSLPKLVGFVATKDSTVDGLHVNTDKFLTTNEVSCVKDKDALNYSENYCSFLPGRLTRRLNHLKYLRIAFCDELKIIFNLKEYQASTTTLNSLTELELYGLRNLVHIWFHVPAKIQAFQKLRVLCVSECSNSYLFSPRVAKLLVQLQKIEIGHCEKMEEIVVRDDNEHDAIVFPKLQVVEIQHMSNLRIFCDGDIHAELPLLETLRLNQCKKMDYFSRFLNAPLLKKMQMNGTTYQLIGDVNTTMNWHHAGWDNWPRGFPVYPFNHINRWMLAQNSRSELSSTVVTTKRADGIWQI